MISPFFYYRVEYVQSFVYLFVGEGLFYVPAEGMLHQNATANASLADRCSHAGIVIMLRYCVVFTGGFGVIRLET
jgi:hypothetical protein